MVKQLITLIYLLGIYQVAFSQFPLEKNTKVAKNELVEFLKNKKCNFLKHEIFKDFETIKFSEEFEIVLGRNYFDNVSYINISAFKSEVFERLKTIFSFTNWKYLGEFPNVENELQSVYHYKNYRIRVPKPDTRYQFIVTIFDEE